MAQLPPKAPSMTTSHQSWAAPPFSSHHRLPMQPSSATALNHPSSPPPPPPHHQSSSCNWMDEFLDFSSARHGAHRRSASDSVAFLESPHIAGLSFDRLDEEHLMSMFSDDIAVAPTMASSSNASSPRSDQNSNNDEVMHDDNVNANDINGHHNFNNHQQLKSEPGDMDGSGDFNDLNSQSTGGPPLPTSPADPKRVKRILANRQSAQRSRVRKLQYISELERSVTSLQSEVSALSPRVAFLDHQRLILNVDNSALKQRIAALAQDKLFKDAHQEALRKEIERLMQVYHNQTLNKMETNDTNNNIKSNQSAATPPQQHHAPADTMIGS